MITKVAVWIRIPRLPIELYTEKFLRRAGAKLGTMLKIDKLTSVHSRGQFARICVEIDLTKKLVSKLEVLGHILHLEYEGLHFTCFSCGRFGHKVHQCVEKGSGETAAERTEGHQQQTTAQADVGETNPKGRTGGISDSTGSHDDCMDENIAQTDHENHGDKEGAHYSPWMIVKRPNRRRPKPGNGRMGGNRVESGNEAGGANNVHGSRFGTLGANHEESMQVDVACETVNVSVTNTQQQPIMARVLDPRAGRNTQNAPRGKENRDANNMQGKRVLPKTSQKL